MLGGISPVMKAAATPFRASSAVRALAYVAIFMPAVPVYIYVIKLQMALEPFRT